MSRFFTVATFLAAFALASGPSAEEPAEPSGATPTGVTRIQGRLIEGRREPVVGASVAVRDEDAAGIVYLTATGSSGDMRVLDIPDGTYRVVFRKAGYENVEKTGVSVRMPLRAVLEVPMRPVVGEAPDAGGDPIGPGSGALDVDGRIHDTTGRGVADVRVRFVKADGAVDPRVSRSGPDGTFRVEGMASGTWNVEVLGVGFLPIRVPVRLDRPIDLTVRLVGQPADFIASPLDLMPPEEPIAPPDLRDAPSSVEIEG